MDRTTWTVLGSLVLLFGLMVLAAQFGGPSQTSGSGLRQPVKKFRAKPGTQRKNARALVSDTPSIPSDSPGGGSDKPIDVWGRLGGSGDSGGAQGSTNDDAPGSDVVRDALSGGDDEATVQQLESYLVGAHPPEEDAALYSALAAIHASAGAQDLDASTENFELALAAVAPEQRSEVIYQQAKTLLDAGEEALALEAIQHQDDRESMSPRHAELAMMEGILLESKGDSKGALTAYQKAFDSAKMGLSDGREASVDVARHAALRLSRLYRKLGDDHAAKEVSKEFKLWLGRSGAVRKSR